MQNPRSSSKLMPSLAGSLLALALVLPNHAPPWMSFLQESLSALALALLVAPPLLLTRHTVPCRATELAVLGLIGFVGLQYAVGQIAFLQTAWMNGLFLLGLLVALLGGAALERRSPSMGLHVIAAAALAAGLVSVGLQFYQWLAMAPGESSAWIYRSSHRPAANLGQPNSLGTVILFSLLATYWFWSRRIVDRIPALAVSVYLVLGLALTQSRTGLLNAAIVGSSLVLWHRRRNLPSLAVPVLGLMTCLLAAFATYAEVGQQLDANSTASRADAGSRPLAWRIFAGSILDRPLTGYGWGQSFVAQMNGTLHHAAQHEVFLSAHNLFLDLALWGGLPLALTVGIALALWLQNCIRKATDDATVVLVLLVVVLLVHAMLEYPLTYAYFLLPGGLIAGALNERAANRIVWRAPKRLGQVLLLLAAAGFALTVRDYLRVEQSYRDLLFEKARIQRSGQGTPPDVIALTSLRDLVIFSRVVPTAPMSEAELNWLRKVASVHPGAAGFEKVARALAISGQPAEAQRWVDMLCSIFDEHQCALLAEAWGATARQYPQMKAVRWPN